MVTSLVAPEFAASMRALVQGVAGPECRLENVAPGEYETTSAGADADGGEAAGADSNGNLAPGGPDGDKEAARAKAARAKQVQQLTDLFDLYDAEEPNA